MPLLLIGTKFDQIPENKRSEVLTRTAFLSEDFNAEEINLVGFYKLQGSETQIKLFQGGYFSNINLLVTYMWQLISAVRKGTIRDL